MTGAPPRVFISYSHDSAEHEAGVLGLADRLRADGVDAEVDQYNTSPAEGWPLWCERQIKAADFVLMVCTESYHRRVTGEEQPNTGLGVVWEAGIIRQLLYDIGAVSNKFIPVLFSEASAAHVPALIKGRTWYVVDTEYGYESLYRLLSAQPGVARPPLGTLRPLPVRFRKCSEHVSASVSPTPPPARDAGSIVAASAYIGQAASDNRFPDCLYIDIAMEQESAEKLRIILTIAFSNQTMNCPIFSTIFSSFGLRGGDLRLYMENIEVIEFLLLGNLDLEIAKKAVRKTGRGDDERQDAEVGGGFKMKAVIPEFSIGAKIGRSMSSSRTSSEETEIAYSAWQVVALHGQPPGWRFRLQNNEAFLEGNLERQPAAVCAHMNKSEGFSVKAQFEIMQKHILFCFDDSSILGCLAKYKIVSIFAWKHCLKESVRPYLSMVRLQSF